MNIDLGHRLTTFREPPHGRVRSHAHDTWHLLFLVDGAFEEEVTGGGVHLKAGQARLSRADAVHNIDFGVRGATCAVVHLDSRWAFQLGDVAQEHQFLRDPTFGASAADFLRMTRSAARAPWLAVGGLLHLRRLLQLACRFRCSDEPPPAPQWLIDADAAMAAGKRIDQIAKAARMSREHLARSCKEHFGYTPREARRVHALAKAVELLCATPCSLTEVALRSGFSDQSHLTNACRAVLRTTPGRVRRDVGITNLQDAFPLAS